MAYITTIVVVQVVCLIVVYLVFLAVAYGVPRDQDHEIEVKLFPPSIRRKIKCTDRRS
jgi:hypothetical protein